MGIVGIHFIMKSLTLLIVAFLSLMENVSAGTCKDNHWYCPQWKALGYCVEGNIYHGFLKKTCPLTCGFCKGYSGQSDLNNNNSGNDDSSDSGQSDSTGSSKIGEKNQINAENIEMILKAHNKHRANVSPSASNMEKMYWDDKLAEAAQKHIDTCPDGHDSNKKRKSSVGYGIGVGQNLAWNSREVDWANSIGRWHGEVKDFQFGVGSTNGEAVGHYTAMVKAESNSVGCGYAYCPDHKYKHHYGCDYAFAQPNYKYPYELGQSCEACGSNCENNMCDCGGLICKNGGAIDLTTCTCECAHAFSGNDCGICPASDPARNCNYWFTNYGNPCKFSNVQTECPYACGLC